MKTNSTRPTVWIARGLLVLALALIVYLGWRAARTALYARAALADLDRLQAATASPSLERLPSLESDLAALESHLTETRRAGAPFLALAPHLGWLPRYGADIVAAPPLLDMAVELAGAGREVLAALGPLAGRAGEDGGLSLLPEIASELAAAEPQLASAHQRLERAQELRALVPSVSIDRVASLLAQLDGLLPLAADALELARVAPALLGEGGERTYLILAQNSDELRATGGFISATGVVRLVDGALAEMSFADSYAADNLDAPQLVPPAPLQEQMGLQLWLMRDSNWSPDFPQTAEVARAIYAQNQGVWADGVIALDLEAVRLLVAALGPLQLEGADQPVTGDNALEWMKRSWEAPATGAATVEESFSSEWWRNRKSFMSELASAILARAEAGSDLNFTALGGTVMSMLQQRHLQIFVDDPVVSKLLARHSWDGALHAPAGQDFLAVVDSNVGYNKANALVKPSIRYQVASSPEGLVAEATISYNHTAPAGAEEVCDRAPRYGDSYDAMARRCYWNYLRVYAPQGATLLDAEGLSNPQSETGEGGTTVISGDFVLRPGEQHSVRLRYRLPTNVTAEPYRLLVRKQAGGAAAPLSVQAGGCTATTLLATDHEFECAATAP